MATPHVIGTESNAIRLREVSVSRAAERLLWIALGVLVVLFGVDAATHSVDFPIYHRIATQVWHGQYELYPEAVYGNGAAPAHGFRYAPAVAFLLVPLGWLSLSTAAFLFFSLKVAAVIYIGTVMMRHLGVHSRSGLVLLVALVCVAGYVAEEFRYGNVHFFVVALMVFAFDAVESGGVVAPAIALGLAIATKLTPVLLLGYFVVRRRFAVAAATVAVLVALAFLPAAIIGMRANTHLLEGFGRYAVEKIDEGDNYALRGVLVHYLMPEHDEAMGHGGTQSRGAVLSDRAVTLIWVALVLVGVVVVAAAFRYAPAGPAAAWLELSIVLIAMLLASPHTQRRYLVALYVPMVALAALVANTADATNRRLMIFGLGVTAATGTFLPLVFGGRRLALVYEAGSPYFFGTLALFVTLVVLRMRLQDAKPAAETTRLRVE